MDSSISRVDTWELEGVGASEPMTRIQSSSSWPLLLHPCLARFLSSSFLREAMGPFFMPSAQEEKVDLHLTSGGC